MRNLKIIVLVAGLINSFLPARANPGPFSSKDGPVRAKMEQAWKLTWNEFYHPKTSMFYDYLSSYLPGRGLDHLPKAREVRKQFPNVQGYDTGMEDCMISAGVLMDMVIDKYEVTHDEEMKSSAYAIYKGIRNSAMSPGIEGFVARCVCVEDGKSIYISSSRDQFTHAVFGLWQYYFSPLSTDSVRTEVAEILSFIADRAIKFVTPENDYDFSRADGSRDTRGISRMWNVDTHEWARLPMIYAAAWITSSDSRYFDQYIKYGEEGILKSHGNVDKVTTYALLQMAISLDLLERYERSAQSRKSIAEIKKRLAGIAQNRAREAVKRSMDLDLTRVGSDWRDNEGLRPSGEYRKVWYVLREIGEAALTQLVANPESFNLEQKELLTTMINKIDFNTVSSNGIFYIQAAYWKARKLGLISEKE